MFGDNKLITKLTKQKYLANTWYFWSGGFMENLKNKLPITFYNFDENEFEIKKSEIEQSEVYKRNDTLKMYEIENKVND